MKGLTKATYPAYEPAAKFKCNRGCGTFRRDQCGTFRGQLHCPACRYCWTLSYVDSPAAIPDKETIS